MRKSSYQYLAVLALFLVSCSAQQLDSFSEVGSSVLKQTGVVSASQADSFFKFGKSLNSSVEEMTSEQEYYLGRGVSATILGKYKPLQNKALNSYLNKIATVLALASERPETFGGYVVQVLDSPEINAISAPGGFIFITSGFLRIVPNEDALAAVMAHEVAHIVRGHGVSLIKSSNLTDALMQLGKANTPAEISSVSNQLTSVFGDGVSDIANSLLVKGYSRSQEYEADADALVLLRRSGYSPGGLAVMLKSLDSNSSTASTGGWTSTHPDPDDRLSEVGDNDQAAFEVLAARDKRFRSALGSL